MPWVIASVASFVGWLGGKSVYSSSEPDSIVGWSTVIKLGLLVLIGLGSFALLKRLKTLTR